MSVIRQREVGRDTESYAAGAAQSLRQDPDVIFLGEIRDQETALAAIQAAQTGHLVMSTMHTIDAAETISRIVEMFPPEQQEQMRVSVAGALRGVVSQRLLERADGRGRVPAVEVMLNTGRVYDRILDPELTADARRHRGQPVRRDADVRPVAAGSRARRPRDRGGRARGRHEPARLQPRARHGRDRAHPGARRAGRPRRRPG